MTGPIHRVDEEEPHPERYSLTVRRFVAEGVATRSFDTTLAELVRQGIAVPGGASTSGASGLVDPTRRKSLTR